MGRCDVTDIRTKLIFRNPDLDLAGPWCYTTDPEKRWEYCEIEHCATDDSFVIFTNFDADQKSSHLVRVHANPEIVRSHTDDGGSFNVQTISMTNTNETMTGTGFLIVGFCMIEIGKKSTFKGSPGSTVI